MNKKGFTLVELLAVIVVLLIVALVAFPSLIFSIKKNEEDGYNAVVENITLAAQALNSNYSGAIKQVSVPTLIDMGYLKGKQINPKNNTEMNGCIFFSNGNYYYKEENCDLVYDYDIANDQIDTYIGQIWKYDYTGSYQVFTVPANGYYKLETWGASGGTGGDGIVSTIGKGAYTKGNIYLKQNQKIYVFVGAQGLNEYAGNNTSMAYNGGGYGEGQGGGATDFRYLNSASLTDELSWKNIVSLRSRIMVAGGGGGPVHTYSASFLNATDHSGSGGGLQGIDAYFNAQDQCGYGGYGFSGHGGTQVSGGQPGSSFSSGIDPVKTSTMVGQFGIGGYGVPANGSYLYSASGGGGGYYGGGHGNHPGCTWSGGGGGSSFISGYLGAVAVTSSNDTTPRNDSKGVQCTEESATSDITCSYHYSGLIFSNTEMKAGNETMPTHDGTSEMTGNTGNGYAKVTYIGQNN